MRARSIIPAVGLILFSGLWGYFSSDIAWAQVAAPVAVLAQPGGAPPAMPPAAMPPGMDPAKWKEIQEKMAAAQKNAAGGKPEAGKDGAPDKDKKEEKKDEAVKRPTEPPKPPDPAELKVRPDKDDKVNINFKGQPWPAVLEWLADISGKSFDWQESPGGFLNLTTSRGYTVAEMRDLINRLLLARGYTLLERGEVISLVNVKNIDPSMVPRIEPDELAARQPHEFVKVSFALERLMSETAVEELKPMLSPNGKLTAMPETNRIEAMDAVVNLREIRDLVAREQSAEVEKLRPRMFKLQYRRASEVVPQLQTLLGIQSTKAPAGPMDPQQQMQEAQQRAMMQAMQQQQQQQQQGDKNKQPAKPKQEAEINFLADDRNNCILAQAPPDKMAVIAQAIKVIDVPLDRPGSLQATIGRMQIYHLAAMNPEPLVRTLKEIGNLDLDTRLEVDQANRSIIAYATLADHVTIRALIEKLDGSARRFEVIPLRRLEADYVAGTIQTMIFGGEEEKQDNNSSRWSWFGRPSEPKQEKKDNFRVDADVENNRLLLWANDVEFEDVRKFLVKLGEIPPQDGRPEKVRILDVYEKVEAEELLERLRRAWPEKNRLQIDSPAAAPQESKPADDSSRSVRQATPGGIIPAQFSKETAAEQAAEQPVQKSPPPITITRNAEGRLVITSDDTAALDRLESLIAELSPPRKQYKIYRLKFAWAYDVVTILESFFKEEGEGKQRVWDPYWWDYTAVDKPKGLARLSKRRPLRFIVDSESNSVLVQGADAEQIHVVEELIAFYDKVEKTDSQNIRQTAVFTIRHSKAKVIADAIKEVYRDLLSSTDKAFSSDKKTDNRSESRYTYYFGSRDGGDDDKVTKAPKFKGLLSIGVDEVSNTLLVSAPTYLFENVKAMIQALDSAAEPVADVSVMQINSSIDPEQLKKILNAASVDSSINIKPSQKTADKAK